VFILLIICTVVYNQFSFKSQEIETFIDNIAKNVKYLKSELTMEIGFWENKNHNLPLVYSITDQLWEHLKETDKIRQWIEYD